METEKGFWDDAPVIYSYTRADAIDDGYLVDLSEMDGAKGHFKFPLACTSAVWAIVEAAVKCEKRCNDLAGVLHDICWMTRFGRPIDPTTRLFKVIITGPTNKKNYVFKIVCGPGDTPEPVMTIMLPEEED